MFIKIQSKVYVKKTYISSKNLSANSSSSSSSPMCIRPEWMDEIEAMIDRVLKMDEYQILLNHYVEKYAIQACHTGSPPDHMLA